MLETLINAITRGGIYALIALGYTMVYGILGMINFAHGEIFMLGMFAGIIALACMSTLGVTLGSFVALGIAVAFAMIMSATFGYTNERLAYRPLRRAHALAPLISAIGMSIVLQNFIMNAQSKDKVDFPRRFSQPLIENHIVFGELARISYLQIMIIVTSIVLMIALHLFVSRTKLGTAMRATSQDKTMAALVGISIDRVVSLTFVIGSALAGAAGVMVAMYHSVARFDSGYLAGLKAFTAAVLGGIGNIPGAMLGGFLIGLAEDFTAATPWGSDWKDVVAFVILIIVLIVRPKGILGERVAEKV